MATLHHVIIGNGVAGNRAAAVLRARDPDNRITIISLGGLLFYDRYQLPQVFQGKRDWRDYLV
jgi:NADPH-dependent 2,4-dienoyl-CoA reductase/sulfur reductase-like enzyme